MLPIWEPLTQPHTQAQVRPRSPFPSLTPSPPPPPGHRQTLTVPGGAHQLVQHRAHLGLRRHGGGVASGRAGVGRRPGPFGLGGQGKGWGKVRRCLSCRRRRRRPEAYGKGAGGLVGESGLRSSRRCVKWKAAAPESNPRSLTLRRVLGQKRYVLSKLLPPTPPPARSRQPPLQALTPLAATVAGT